MMEQGADSMELTALLLVIGSSFVATNLDNLLILVGLLGTSARRGAAVLMGYVAAALAVLVVSLLGGLLGSLIDPALVGYLGAIPLLLGVYLLYQTLLKPSPGPPRERGRAEGAVEAGAAGGLSAFTLMVSNSGDSIALFLPLFAESSRDALILEVVTYLVLVMVWAALARLVAERGVISRVLERYGPILVPFIMMGVGIYILLDTAFDTLR